jgi:polar amino acid transport system substrate-binding protein
MKRFVFVFLLVSLVFFAATIEAQGGDSTLDRVEETGQVRIGVRFDNPPLSFIDEDGNWVGFDVDLANEIAERLDVEIEMVRVDEITRISFLQEGQIDLAVASMNHTRSRDAAVDFSITYFWDSQTFLVREGEFDSLDDLYGQLVAMNAGSSAIDAWNRYVETQGGEPSEIVEFTDKVAAVQALRDGAVDGYAEDGITLAALAAGDDSLVLLSEGFNPVQYGVGLPENDSEWRDTINYILQDIWTDGTYFEMYDRWLGPDAEVQLPLGGEMEIWR